MKQKPAASEAIMCSTTDLVWDDVIELFAQESQPKYTFPYSVAIPSSTLILFSAVIMGQLESIGNMWIMENQNKELWNSFRQHYNNVFCKHGDGTSDSTIADNFFSSWLLLPEM
jgi:hypothetical protein